MELPLGFIFLINWAVAGVGGWSWFYPLETICTEKCRDAGKPFGRLLGGNCACYCPVLNPPPDNDPCDDSKAPSCQRFCQFQGYYGGDCVAGDLCWCFCRAKDPYLLQTTTTTATTADQPAANATTTAASNSTTTTTTGSPLSSLSTLVGDLGGGGGGTGTSGSAPSIAAIGGGGGGGSSGGFATAEANLGGPSLLSTPEATPNPGPSSFSTNASSSASTPSPEVTSVPTGSILAAESNTFENSPTSFNSTTTTTGTTTPCPTSPETGSGTTPCPTATTPETGSGTTTTGTTPCPTSPETGSGKTTTGSGTTTPCPIALETGSDLDLLSFSTTTTPPNPEIPVTPPEVTAWGNLDLQMSSSTLSPGISSHTLTWSWNPYKLFLSVRNSLLNGF